MALYRFERTWNSKGCREYDRKHQSGAVQDLYAGTRFSTKVSAPNTARSASLPAARLAWEVRAASKIEARCGKAVCRR